MSSQLTPAMIAASSQDISPSIMNLCIVMIVFSTLAIVLRFWSRALIEGIQKFWWDDWLALFTWAVTIVELGLTLHWTTLGLGKHVYAVPLNDVIEGLQVLYIGTFFFYLGVGFAKFSCLIYYVRIFTIQNKFFRAGIWISGGLVAAWLVVCMLGAIWQCTPIAKAWDPLLPGHCLDYFSWSTTSSHSILNVSNIVIDVLILLLPMPMIWTLNMGRVRIALFIGVFVAGYCVVVISTGKTVAFVKGRMTLAEDITYNSVKCLYWLTPEAPMSIISICLPAIFSLCKRGIELGPYSLISSKVTSRRSPGRGWNRERSKQENQNGFAKLFGDRTIGDQEHGISQTELVTRESN
ncbi:hypothetical protein NHQ30_002932 [Ciborinia camelliae]|nr:hypothetical protein NHQ30_002932 [Ciborinia camelliae]